MDDWINDVLASSSLTEEAEGYLLGRGVTEDAISEFGYKVWESPSDPAPDQGVFKDRYGELGSRLNGMLAYPLYCPRGVLLGFEARTYDGEKKVTRYLLNRANWNPIWYGFPRAMSLIWEGKEPWVFEGVFDVEALRNILPDEPLLASLRAKMTNKHVSFLDRYLRKRRVVHLVYDHDETGQKGIKRAVYVLKQVGIECRPVPYTGGKDPGKVWEDTGTSGLRKAFRL